MACEAGAGAGAGAEEGEGEEVGEVLRVNRKSPSSLFPLWII